MINTDMKTYIVYGPATDSYGTVAPDFTHSYGKIDMAVYVTNIDAQRNSAWAASPYMGLTPDVTAIRRDSTTGETTLTELWTYDCFLAGPVDDSSKEKILKVEVIYKKGRFYQVFMNATSYSRSNQ